jgi:hypothetical protein
MVHLRVKGLRSREVATSFRDAAGSKRGAVGRMDWNGRMTRKNASKKAARARQAKHDGKYQSHLRHVEAQKSGAAKNLCASCAPMYGYEPSNSSGMSLGDQCYGCSGSFEILGMFTVPNPDGGFPSLPLTKEQLAKRRIVHEEDSFGAFGAFDDDVLEDWDRDD